MSWQDKLESRAGSPLLLSLVWSLSLNLSTQVCEGSSACQGSISQPPTGFATRSGHHPEGAKRDSNHCPQDSSTQGWEEGASLSRA